MLRYFISIIFISFTLFFSPINSKNWKEWGTDMSQKWLHTFQDYANHFLTDEKYPFIDKKTFEYPIDQKGKLTVDGKIGQIIIEGTNSNQIKVTVFKRAAKKERLNDLEYSIEHKHNEIIVKTKREKSNTQAELDYYIQVPHKTRLKEIETNTGNITIKEVENSINAKTNLGSIDISRVTGSIKARAQTGSITIQNASGMIDAKTNSGTIEIDQEKKASPYIIAHTENGNIHIHNASGSVKAITSNGSILSHHLLISAESSIKLETKNGSIAAKFPKTLNASIRAETKLGEIKSDFELEQIVSNESKTAKGEVGSGTAKIAIGTHCGSITIKKIVR